MIPTEFKPGLQFSLFDGLVLAAAGLIAAQAHRILPWAGGLIVFVVLHFFLFCNVFRIARAAELLWAGCVLTLGALTLTMGFPGWAVTYAAGSLIALLLIWRETRQPRYHGIFWKRLNPRLPEFWASRQADGEK